MCHWCVGVLFEDLSIRRPVGPAVPSSLLLRCHWNSLRDTNIADEMPAKKAPAGGNQVIPPSNLGIQPFNTSICLHAYTIYLYLYNLPLFIHSFSPFH